MDEKITIENQNLFHVSTIGCVGEVDDNEVNMLTLRAVDMMKDMVEIVEKLADERMRCKLSNGRVVGIAKELRELIKVMNRHENDRLLTNSCRVKMVINK